MCAALPLKSYAAEPKLRNVFARGKHVVPLGVRDYERRTADVQSMIDLWSLVAVVKRRRHKSGLDAGQIMNDQRAAIRQQRGHAIARSEAHRQILFGKPRR